MPPRTPAVAGIVHGDYRLDNLLVGTTTEVRAVVDWEMATLGDTRTDLALLLVYDRLVRGRRRRPGRRREHGTGLPGRPRSSWPGTPRPAAATWARWASTSALAYFKLAVILEGIHYRYLQGQTVGEGFDQIGARVRPAASPPASTHSSTTKGLTWTSRSTPAPRSCASELLDFMDEHVDPAEPVFHEQLDALDDRWAWSTAPVLDELRAEARDARAVEPLPARREHGDGAGLTNLQYAPLAEITGRSRPPRARRR